MHIPEWYLNGTACPTCGEVHDRCGDHVKGDRNGATKRPCRGQPRVGQWRCGSHASEAERSERIDVEAMIQQHRPIGELLRRCSVAVKGRTYIESLEDALHRANTMVVLLSMLIETLPARSQTSQVVVAEGTPRERVEYETTVDGMVGPDHEGDLGVHPYVTLYRDWVDTQAKLSKAAADLGLTERQVQVQEVQVRIIASTLSAILTDLNIDLADPRTRAVVENHLLRMETASVDIGRSLTATATAS